MDAHSPQHGSTSVFTVPKRDAYASIRGFVYQVDLTVWRWLHLEFGQELELESAEDIDLLSRAMVCSVDEQSRLAEQVKHIHARRITLHTPSTLIALANANARRLKEPTTVFRFTTNAGVGVERESPFGNVAGITVWQRVRGASSIDGDTITNVAGLRALINRKTPPKGVNKSTWALFRGLISSGSNEALLELINSFEWSPNERDASRLRDDILRVIDPDLVHDAGAPYLAYCKLFVHVFLVLSTAGLKRLHRSEIEHVIATETPATPREQLIESLPPLLVSLDARVTGLENRTTVLEQESVTRAEFRQLEERFSLMSLSRTTAFGSDSLVSAAVSQRKPHFFISGRMNHGLDDLRILIHDAVESTKVMTGWCAERELSKESTEYLALCVAAVRDSIGLLLVASDSVSTMVETEFRAANEAGRYRTILLQSGTKRTESLERFLASIVGTCRVYSFSNPAELRSRVIDALQDSMIDAYGKNPL